MINVIRAASERTTVKSVQLARFQGQDRAGYGRADGAWTGNLGRVGRRREGMEGEGKGQGCRVDHKLSQMCDEMMDSTPGHQG